MRQQSHWPLITAASAREKRIPVPRVDIGMGKRGKLCALRSCVAQATGRWKMAKGG